MDKIQVLELFAGSGSLSKVCAQHPDLYEVTSLDISDKLYPVSFQCDIMDWNYKLFPPGSFDIIWGSPPCTHYSVARTTGKLPRDIEGSNKIVQRVLDIIKWFKPTVAYMENPSTGSLKKQPFMQNLTSWVVHYCMYDASFGYRKSTQIWSLGSSKCDNFIPKTCTKEGRCICYSDGKHPKTFASKRSAGVSLADRYRVPATLLEELLEHAKEEIVKERDRQDMI
jgi:hypothetical protein